MRIWSARFVTISREVRVCRVPPPELPDRHFAVRRILNFGILVNSCPKAAYLVYIAPAAGLSDFDLQPK